MYIFNQIRITYPNKFIIELVKKIANPNVWEAFVGRAQMIVILAECEIVRIVNETDFDSTGFSPDDILNEENAHDGNPELS